MKSIEEIIENTLQSRTCTLGELEKIIIEKGYSSDDARKGIQEFIKKNSPPPHVVE